MERVRKIEAKLSRKELKNVYQGGMTGEDIDYMSTIMEISPL